MSENKKLLSNVNYKNLLRILLGPAKIDDETNDNLLVNSRTTSLLILISVVTSLIFLIYNLYVQGNDTLESYTQDLHKQVTRALLLRRWFAYIYREFSVNFLTKLGLEIFLSFFAIWYIIHRVFLAQFRKIAYIFFLGFGILKIIFIYTAIMPYTSNNSIWFYYMIIMSLSIIGYSKTYLIILVNILPTVIFQIIYPDANLVDDLIESLLIITIIVIVQLQYVRNYRQFSHEQSLFKDRITAMEALKDNLDSGVLILDEDMKIQGFYNRIICQHLREAELKGKSFIKIIAKISSINYDELRRQADMYVKKVFSTPANLESEEIDIFANKGRNIEIKSPKGISYLQFNFCPIILKSGVARLIVTSKDVSATILWNKRLEVLQKVDKDSAATLFQVLQQKVEYLEEIYPELNRHFEESYREFNNRASLIEESQDFIERFEKHLLWFEKELKIMKLDRLIADIDKYKIRIKKYYENKNNDLDLGYHDYLTVISGIKPLLNSWDRIRTLARLSLIVHNKQDNDSQLTKQELIQLYYNMGEVVSYLKKRL